MPAIIRVAKRLQFIIACLRVTRIVDIINAQHPSHSTTEQIGLHEQTISDLTAKTRI